MYVLRLDELERSVHAHTIAAAVASAMGAEGDGMPSWDEVRASFDEDLAEVPADQAPLERTRGIKLRALGVG